MCLMMHFPKILMMEPSKHYKKSALSLESADFFVINCIIFYRIGRMTQIPCWRRWVAIYLLMGRESRMTFFASFEALRRCRKKRKAALSYEVYCIKTVPMILKTRTNLVSMRTPPLASCKLERLPDFHWETERADRQEFPSAYRGWVGICCTRR